MGEWVHSEVFHASPLGAEGKGAARSKATWILRDQYVYVLYASRRPWGVTEARGYFGWDAEAQAYALDWFDESGIRKRFRGQFAGTALVLAAEYPLEGKRARERWTLRVREDGKLLSTSEITLGNQSAIPVMESLLSPVSKAP